jgi:hypothetical protein
LSKAYLFLPEIRQEKRSSAAKPGKLQKKAVFSLNNCGRADYQAIIALQKSGKLLKIRGKTKMHRGSPSGIGGKPKLSGGTL